MRLISVMVWVLALVMSGPASPENRPISLELVSPPQLKNDGLMLSRHWALTLRLEIREVEYYQIDQLDMDVVYDDPDGCPSWSDGVCAVDESWVTITPDYRDSAGEEDVRPERCERMKDDLFDEWNIDSLNKPHLFAAPISVSPVVSLIPVGPDTGEQVADCFGYGRDDDIPGLVVMADVGGTRMFNAEFTTIAGRIRNLAGFVSQLSLEPLDSKSHTAIIAAIPIDDLFQPIVVVDMSVAGQPGLLLQEDGGSPVFLEGDPQGSISGLLEYVNDVRVVTLRSVMVEGEAPDFIDDLDGDGEYTANDVSLAGYTLLSNEVRTQIVTREWVTTTTTRPWPCVLLDPDHHRFAGINFLYATDLDGNGSPGGLECDDGDGSGRGVTRVRR